MSDEQHRIADSASAVCQSGPPREETSRSAQWKAVVVCLVPLFMTQVDTSIVNVALPSIREGLGAGTGVLVWIVAGYALAAGLVLIPAGRFGDAGERRVVFFAGVALFTAASAAAGLAPGGTWLVVARIAQGVGAGITAPQVAGFIQGMFRGEARGRAFGAMGATVGVANAVGPLLGGALVVAGGEEGWRWVFYINVPVGLAALVLAPLCGSRRRRAARGRRGRTRWG